MGVPLVRVQEALETMLMLIQEASAPVLVGLRFVRASDATLAFTQYREQTCVLEIAGPHSRRVMSLYRAIWQALRDLAIPYTPHWGTIHELDVHRVRQAYGTRVDAWLKARRELLPTDDLRQLFANEYLRKLGMDA